MKAKANKGHLVAKMLAGAWRVPNPAPLELSVAELDAVTPLLYDSGTAALGWQRIKDGPLRGCASAEVLHQAYRLQSLQSEIHEQKIQKIFRLFREAGIDAILAKGWAAAGMYHSKALRPYGDIDLCVRAADVGAALRILSDPAANDCWVDLHEHFAEIDDRSVAELFARSRVVSLNNEPIRLLGLEDQVALSCIHMLKHGAWRPLWLCDVGVALDLMTDSFDWDICVGSNDKRQNWIGSAIALAKHLLDANTEQVPPRLKIQLPEWMIQNVLQQWDSPFAIYQPPMSHPIPMADLLRHPTGLVHGLRQRWPNPIIATISVNGEFNNLPRLPYQLANCFSRIGRLLFGSPNGLSEH